MAKTRGRSLDPMPIGGPVMGSVWVPRPAKTASAPILGGVPGTPNLRDLFLGSLQREGGISRADAEKVMAVYLKERVLKGTTAGYDLKHGGFMERDVIHRALALANEKGIGKARSALREPKPSRAAANRATAAPASALPPPAAPVPPIKTRWTDDEKAEFEADYQREMATIRRQRAEDAARVRTRQAGAATSRLMQTKIRAAAGIVATKQAEIGHSVASALSAVARRPVQTGPRGGRFIVTESGTRWYVTGKHTGNMQ